jgi:hypothetical protein
MPNMTWSPDLRPRSITWFLAALWLCATVVTAQEDLTTWNKRMPITLAGYTPPTVAETLTNFPVLVVLSNTPSGAGFDYNDFLAPPMAICVFRAPRMERPSTTRSRRGTPTAIRSFGFRFRR